MQGPGLGSKLQVYAVSCTVKRSTDRSPGLGQKPRDLPPELPACLFVPIAGQGNRPLCTFFRTVQEHRSTLTPSHQFWDRAAYFPFLSSPKKGHTFYSYFKVHKPRTRQVHRPFRGGVLCRGVRRWEPGPARDSTGWAVQRILAVAPCRARCWPPRCRTGARPKPVAGGCRTRDGAERTRDCGGRGLQPTAEVQARPSTRTPGWRLSPARVRPATQLPCSPPGFGRNPSACSICACAALCRPRNWEAERGFPAGPAGRGVPVLPEVRVGAAHGSVCVMLLALAGFRRRGGWGQGPVSASVRSWSGAMPRRGKEKCKDSVKLPVPSGPVVTDKNGSVTIAIHAKPGSKQNAIT
ncbi:unnamed protein product, partial [Eretmochelys imbricata]